MENLSHSTIDEKRPGDLLLGFRELEPDEREAEINAELNASPEAT